MLLNRARSDGDEKSKATAKPSGPGNGVDIVRTALLRKVLAKPTLGYKRKLAECPDLVLVRGGAAIDRGLELYKDLERDPDRAVAEALYRAEASAARLRELANETEEFMATPEGASKGMSPDMLSRVFFGENLRHRDGKQDKEYDELLNLCAAVVEQVNPYMCIDFNFCLEGARSSNSVPEGRIHGHFLICGLIGFSTEFRRHIEPFCQIDRLEDFTKRIAEYLDVFVKGNTVSVPRRVKGTRPTWKTMCAFVRDMRVAYVCGAFWDYNNHAEAPTPTLSTLKPPAPVSVPVPGLATATAASAQPPPAKRAKPS